ncbi:MAG TPA: hypothetical protein VII95_14520 [Terriglobales bacterium]|jgi:hypothetical protein
MPPDEYVKALDKALSDLEDRVQRRDLLNAEIAGLRETVRVLCNRVTIPPDRQQRIAQLLAMVDYATPNLTDSIRGLLTQIHPTYLTAIEVRNTLEDKGFNFDDFSNSLSACHAALKRMLSDKEVELGPEANGKATYKRVLPRIPSLAERAGYSMGELTRAWFEAGEEKGGPLAALPGVSADPWVTTLGEMMRQKPSDKDSEKKRKGVASKIMGR